MEEKEFRHCPLCGAGLEAKLVEGRKRLVCPRCFWIRYLNPLPCSAAFVANSHDEILLVQRGVEPGRGKWGLPSGFIEIEETPEEACLRELQEETGLSGRIKALIGVFSQLSLVYKRVIIIGFSVEAEGKLSPGSDSIAADYFSTCRLPEIAFTTHKQIIKEGVKLGKR